MDKTIDIKKQILEELKNEKYIYNVDENSKIVQMLRNASKSDSELYKDFKKYQNLKNDKNAFEGQEIFKFAWKVGKTKYNYFASNYGRIGVTKDDSFNLKNEKNFLIKSENGYLKPFDENKDFCVSIYTDLYFFVVEAFRDEFICNLELLNEYKKNNIRLEVHHINNQPDDNRVSNLIYLPRTIHYYAHG